MPQTLTLEEFNTRYAPKTLTLDEMGEREVGPAPASRTFEPPTFAVQEAVGKAFKDLYEGAIVAPARNLYGGFKLGAAGASQLEANAMMLINRAGDYLTEKTGVGAMSKDTAFGEVEKWLRQNARQLTGDAEPHLDDNTLAQIYSGLGQAPAAIAEYAIGGRLVGPVAGFAGVDALHAADQGPKEVAKAAAKGALVGSLFKGAAPLLRPQRAGALATIGGTQAAVEGGDVSDVTAGAATLGILGAMGGRGQVGVRDLLAKPRTLTLQEMDAREFTGTTIREPGRVTPPPGRPAQRGEPFERPQAPVEPEGVPVPAEEPVTVRPAEPMPGRPIPEPPSEPIEGVPSTVYRGHGRTDRGEAYAGPAEPILGPGRYYAFTPEQAKTFGPEIEQIEFSPKSPLVIRSDQEWRALTKEAGWKFPNPFGQDDAQIRQDIGRLQEIIRGRGHDAVAVTWDDTTRTDTDRFGNTIKNLRNVFGQPQAFQFEQARVGEARQAEPTPPEVAPAPPEITIPGRPIPEVPRAPTPDLTLPADLVRYLRGGREQSVEIARQGSGKPLNRIQREAYLAGYDRRVAEIEGTFTGEAETRFQKGQAASAYRRGEEAVGFRVGQFQRREAPTAPPPEMPVAPTAEQRAAELARMKEELERKQADERAVREAEGKAAETPARGPLPWQEVPESVRRAVAAFRAEGEGGIRWQFDHGGGRGEMEVLNQLLVKRNHPLAKQAGNDWGRFVRVATEMAKAREDIKNLDFRTGEEGPAEAKPDPLPPPEAAVFRSEAEGRAELPPGGPPKPLRIPIEAGIGVPETTQVRGPDGSIRVEVVRKPPPADTPTALGEIRFKSVRRSTEAYLDEAARSRTARTLSKDQKALAEEARKSNLAAFDAAHQELANRVRQADQPSMEGFIRNAAERAIPKQIPGGQRETYIGGFNAGATTSPRATYQDPIVQRAYGRGYEDGQGFRKSPDYEQFQTQSGVKIETITARDKRTAFEFPATEEGLETLLATKKRYEKLPVQTTGYGMRLPEGEVLAAETEALEAGEKYVGMRRQTYDPDKEPLPKGQRPLTREAVLAPLLKDLGIPLYQGRVKGERLGFFRPKLEEVRVKKHADLEVTAHELAHLLDRRFPELRKQWHPARKANKAFRDELREISYDKKKLYEGYAEFMRLWSTQPTEAQTRAPKFYDWFEGFLDRNRHGPAIRRSKDQMLAWFEQTALDRARSKVGQQEAVNEVVEASGGRRFRQGALDDLYGILNAEMSLYGTYNGPTYQSARLTRGSSGIVQAALQYGVPRWAKGRVELLDGAGEPLNLITDKGKVVANPKARPWGLERILEPIAGDLDTGVLYFVGKRADLLRRQGRERLFSAAEIKAMLALETPARAKAFEDWNRFNSQLLDFAEQSGTIDPVGRQSWETGVYLPFWRVAQGSPGSSLVEGIPGFTKIIRRLRGGTQNIRDPIANMFQNTRMLIESSINNQARREVVDMIMAAEGTSAERPGGARFLTKIPKENRRVRVLTEAMRNSVKEHFARDQSKQVAAVERSRRGQEEPEIVEAALEKAERAIERFEEMSDEMFDNLAFTSTLNGIVPGQSPNGPTVIAVMRRGKPTFYEVADPQLFLSLTSMPRNVTHNAVMKLLKLPRRIGQATVTLSLDFVLRNIIRDTAMSAVMSEVGNRPLLEAIRGYKSRITRDPAYREWIANGGSIASFWSQEGQFETHLKSYYEKHGIAYNTVINNPRKFLHFIERFADAFEAANRIGEFKLAMEKGRTPREAAFQSREISTDFAMRGDPRQSVLVRGDTAALAFLYDTVLFLKAGAVGVDRVYRGFRYQGNKMTVAAKTGMIALTSIGLHAWNAIENAEEYDALEEWDRNAHWHFWIPVGDGRKEHLRLPKPWEIGGIATISERAIQGVVEQDPSQIGKSLRVVREMFRYDMIPFFAEPLIEQAANRQFFFDRPIVSESLKDLPPWMQAAPRTSRTMAALGEATSKLPEAMGGGLGGGLSPARAEHLLRGYFNAWALYGLTLSDQLFFDEATSLRADQIPGLRSLYRQTPALSTRYRTMFYDMLREATELRRGMRKMDRDNRPEVAGLMEKTPENLEYNQLTAVNQDVQAINADMNFILAARTLPQVQEIANELGREKQFARPIARLRLSKNWRDMGLLKRELRDLWLSERNALFKEAVKDIEAQRKQPQR